MNTNNIISSFVAVIKQNLHLNQNAVILNNNRALTTILKILLIEGYILKYKALKNAKIKV
jgi:ribosomal protein S8